MISNWKSRFKERPADQPPSYKLPWKYCQCGCKGCVAESAELGGPTPWLTFEFKFALTLKHVTLRTAHPPAGMVIGIYPTLEAADQAAREHRASADEEKQRMPERQREAVSA